MDNDYRNTKYCPTLVDVVEKKKTLNAQIIKEHPRVRIIYNQVHDKNGPYKEPFMAIYNYKCAYCGNSITNISNTLFEVDHYIYESSFGDNKAEAGKMDNLVLACYDCNRAKSSLLIADTHTTKLNPDYKDITDVFFRDENYYIQISEDHKEDLVIKNFYEKLKLGYETRRLDFLLLNMRGLCESIKGQPHADKLYSAIVKLTEKRNLSKC